MFKKIKRELSCLGGLKVSLIVFVAAAEVAGILTWLNCGNLTVFRRLLRFPPFSAPIPVTFFLWIALYAVFGVLSALTFKMEGCRCRPLFSALEAKTAGLIRATISNCSALSQKIITKALTSGKFYEQRAANVAIMHERCNAVTKTLAEHPEYREQFIAYPFNSGYFMCLKILKTTTAKLRRRLLDHYATGGIAMSDTDFRLAFSCVEKEQIPELFATIYQACKDLA